MHQPKDSMSLCVKVEPNVSHHFLDILVAINMAYHAYQPEIQALGNQFFTTYKLFLEKNYPGKDMNSLAKLDVLAASLWSISRNDIVAQCQN